MGRKVDVKTAGELNELLHDMMVAIGHASGTGMVKVINEADLTFPQMIILGFLADGPQTVSGLSEMIQLTPGAVSRLIDRMVRKGLVSRREGEDDRRQKTLSLTPAGRRVRERIERARTGSFTAALAALDHLLASDLKDVLTRVVATLRPRTGTPER
jgi:DNA-binding MarR family transcriptional regulator